MAVVQKILNRFNGLHYSQEYLCLSKEGFTDPPRFYLVNNNHVDKEVSIHHVFAGYCPLVFALTEPPLNQGLSIVVTHGKIVPGEPVKKVLARLEMEFIQLLKAGNHCFYFYRGKNGEHHFLSGFHQYIISLNNRFFQRRPGNVFLHTNLYRQVQIAYAYPRSICLITVGGSNLYNLFPTDLHGPVGDDHYIVSLRHEGKACEQVMQHKNILLSYIHPSAYRTAYQLGKNHMQPLKEKAGFNFAETTSEVLNLPLSPLVEYYYELNLEHDFIEGIHRIMLFRILKKSLPVENSQTLAHIHNAYATWRYKNGLPGNYLLR